MLRAHRSTYHYKAHGDEQAELKNRIKEISETFVRYGYRRTHVLLGREGWLVNAKRVYVSTTKWAGNCGTKRRNAGSKPSSGRIVWKQLKAMRLGQWTLCTINWSQAAKSAC